MSIEMHVLFRGKLPNKSALQRAMRELGFPFRITPATGSLEQQSGFMPMRLRQEETGVEFDVFDGREAVESVLDESASVDPALDRRASFRWAGDPTEAAAGLCTAAALAKLVNGIVLDEYEEGTLSVEDAIAHARKNLWSLVPEKPEKTPGTTPRDIKRYLKPLLDLRPDLALVGRHLIIRPVRHVMRGVLFDRTSDKYSFEVWRYIHPLYGDMRSVGQGYSIHAPWLVYEPHFEPLLFDVLAEDIFENLGKLTSLLDFEKDIQGRQSKWSHRVKALLLAGERERASALVEEMERDEGLVSIGLAQYCRGLVERDPAGLFAEFHALEAANAKQLKLGNVWEPSPFPAELPAGDRLSCDEPAFETTPWVMPPEHLWEEFPDSPGDARFCEFARWRKARLILYRPLSRESAKERHATHRHYAMAIRLQDGRQLVVTRDTRWSPHHPEQMNPSHIPWSYFYPSIYGSDLDIHAEFGEDFNIRGN